ncbi:hypothetical protein DFQ04_3097 [Algoriphagus boseongensis]|uniref:Uncharacterized protein n=1 Tax=Algoriphagus boseongensis TaxID=1442587 RepID=A0A4R6T3X3_9BACT|nr:hypothetical protein [Algoriphagus boseongensis]TDQ15211.1 hypothetical protein DFQ04_3097 [Algoriphagus boseongensis]
MQNFEKALISLQKFSESKNIEISLHYTIGEFTEDWLNEKNRVWKDDLCFLLTLTDEIISKITDELTFFTDKLIGDYPFFNLEINNSLQNSELEINGFDEVSKTEKLNFPLQRFDNFGSEWRINNSSMNEFFNHFVERQKPLLTAKKFKQELNQNLEFYQENEGFPPFKPTYSNIDKIPIWGSINKISGIFALLIKHNFLLVRDPAEKRSKTKGLDMFKGFELNSKTITKKKFCEIFSNTFYNLKIEKGVLVESSISSETIKKKLKDSIFSQIHDDEIDDLIKDLQEMVIEFEGMVEFLKKEKTGKMKNKHKID